MLVDGYMHVPMGRCESMEMPEERIPVSSVKYEPIRLRVKQK